VASEQPALYIALEAAAAGLADQPGIAQHPAGVGRARGLAVMRAVAEAGDAAMGARLAKGEAGDAAIAQRAVAADHPAVQREAVSGKAAFAAIAQRARP